MKIILILVTVVVISCQTATVRDTHEDAVANELAMGRELDSLEIVRTREDSIADIKFKKFTGFKELEIKRRSCNNYQNSYAINRKKITEDDIEFLANYIGYRDKHKIRIEACLQGQTILHLYFFKSEKDFGAGGENYIADCLFSGFDQPYLTIKSLN